MNRSELVSTLELVGRALADQPMVPIFTCFCFTGTHVTAYNDAIGIVAPCKTKEAFAVNGGTLLGLLKNSLAKEVEFTLEEHDCIIKAGRSTFRLPWFKQDEFLFEEPQDKWHVNMAINEEFLWGLSACLLTASKDNTQNALMGVCLNGVQHTLYSCDGDAVTRYRLSKSQKSAVVAMMPSAFAEAVLKVAEAIGKEESDDELCVSLEWARAEIHNHVVYGRLIENKTPFDHAKEIKDTIKGEPQFMAVPKGLGHALSRARVVADPESKPTRLTVQEGRLKLLTESSMGIVRDSLQFGDYPEVRANVNAEFVQRAIGLCDEMAILGGCTVYKKGDVLFQLLGNMSD